MYISPFTGLKGVLAYVVVGAGVLVAAGSVWLGREAKRAFSRTPA